MGWQNIFHCEWNQFGQKILKHYWPDATSYGDITTTDFNVHRGQIDIVTGGFPCQPYSQAGKRKGKADDRHLWPQMLRAIREVQPCWVVGENVPGLLNWEGGMVLDEIKADLEAAGFEVFPPLVLPACGKNAPHRRDRLWIVAHAVNERLQHRNTIECGELQDINERIQDNREINRSMCKRIVTNTGLQRQEITEQQPMGIEQFYESGITTNSQRIRQHRQGWAEGSGNTKTSGNWKASWADPNGKWPTVSPIRGRDDGLSAKLVKQCLEALGNAIVPQVAYEIFKSIEINKNFNYGVHH